MDAIAEPDAAQVRDVLDAMSEAVLLFDAEERFVMANARYLELFSGVRDVLGPAVPVSQGLRAMVAAGHLVPPEGTSPDGYADTLIAALHAGERDVQITLGNGRHLRVSSHRTPAGGFLLSFVDETDHVRRERVFLDTLTVLGAALERLGAPMALFDDEVRFVTANGAWRRLFYEDGAGPAPGTHTFDITRHIARRGLILGDVILDVPGVLGETCLRREGLWQASIVGSCGTSM